MNELSTLMSVLIPVIIGGITANFYTTRLAIRLAIQELKNETSSSYVCVNHCNERRAELKEDYDRLEKKLDAHINSMTDTQKLRKLASIVSTETQTITKRG